jgi:aminomethyltransferase
MSIYGKPVPKQPRDTAIVAAEDWYQHLLAERLGVHYTPISRSNFGQYNMATHYITSVLEEAKAIESVAIFNIDHMAQLHFTGSGATALLNRVLPANIENMNIGQCKYTLLLNKNGTVRDDLIVMKVATDGYILVINAGHDLTHVCYETGNEFLSDADFIMSYKQADEKVSVVDISDELVKVDVQGPLSYKLISEIFGNHVLRNRNNPEKNMGFFTFNEIVIDGGTYYFSRTGYTNRWGWEIYIPREQADTQFKKIVEKALDFGGLLVGLGGRDENRMSAGNVGLPLMGNEYCELFTPTNAPLFEAAVDLTKADFVGRTALLNDAKNTQRLVLIIAEGNVIGNGVYMNGVRIGKVTSCIISPNVPLEKRLHIGSSRKNVNEIEGTASIALAWLNESPYQLDQNGQDIIVENGKPVRIAVELFREKDGQPTGKAVLGYVSSDGVNPATASKALKSIE